VTASRPGNLANLPKAAAARTAAATARAEAALDRMPRTGQPVTFRSPAAARLRIAGLPLPQPRHPAARRAAAHPAGLHRPRRHSAPSARPDQPGNVVAALTGELAELKRRRREQVAELQRALQTAHGENLLLRRLGQQQQPACSDQ
jgi:hypothetical protein